MGVSKKPRVIVIPSFIDKEDESKVESQEGNFVQLENGIGFTTNSAEHFQEGDEVNILFDSEASSFEAKYLNGHYQLNH